MESTLKKEVVGNELYLYNAKGELIFKRWIDQGYSYVFNNGMTYGRDTLVSVTDAGTVKK